MRLIYTDIDWQLREQPVPKTLLHYCLNVHRAQAGLVLVVSDGKDKEAEFELVSLDENWCIRRLSPISEIQNIAPITLFFGLPKGDKLDRVVRQVSELGIAKVVLLKMSRNVVTLDAKRAEKKLERLRRVATEAARQSERSRIMEIDGIYSFEAGLEMAKTHDNVFYCHPTASVHMPRGLSGTCAVFVGPEGGLAESESSSMRENGFVGVRLGPTILRTETAAVAAVTTTLCCLDLL